MFLHLIWGTLMHAVVSSISHSGCVWDVSNQPITSTRQHTVLPGGQLQFFFLVMDRTVFSAICCAWPLRWWSTERVTPGRICSKSSLLVLEKDGGSRAWQHAGGLIRPLVKGQMQKTQPEEKAMQDVQPPSSLKLSPKPQLFRCMNKHAQLLSAEVALLALPSTVLFTPGSAKSSSAPDGNLEAKVRKSLFFPGHLATFLLLLWSLPCFFSSSFSCEYLLSPTPLRWAEVLLSQMSALRLKLAPVLKSGWLKNVFQWEEEIKSCMCVVKQYMKVCVSCMGVCM